jgi:hypothetical protein
VRVWTRGRLTLRRGGRSFLIATRGPLWVKMRNTHAEQNRSAFTLVADAPCDMDFRRNGPSADSCTAANNSLFFVSLRNCPRPKWMALAWRAEERRK